jgi:geranylgeranyl pyrophosphate synthase
MRLVGSDRHTHYLDGVDLDQYERTVVAPIRHVLDAGGKAWRSYGLLACIDVAGGDAEQHRDWLVLPELLHTGSLIVDDVQDASPVRRGRESAHVRWGEPLAINAGNACYFFAELPAHVNDLDDARRARIYEIYFQVMRAAHAGQALDIDGLGTAMPEIVEQGGGERLEARVLATHRLKSAAPAASLARMASILAGANDEVTEALASLFEAYGLAFQVVDDVLNLRGFQRGLKLYAEDLSAGKVTFPVARAMTLLPLEERREVWEVLSAKTTDPGLMARALELIEGCGALEQSEAVARSLVERAWAAADPVLPDSHVKLRLRAFGWFVLERHY